MTSTQALPVGAVLAVTTATQAFSALGAPAAFGFCALGWNGVYIAAIARNSPPGGIGLATGGSLSVTYSGVIFMGPAFAAFHDQLDLTWGQVFALLSLVTAAGIACVVLARRAAGRR